MNNSVKINYQKKLDLLIELQQKSGEIPKLLLHSCCAPCSSYVLEYLSEFFEITVFYYNPNIYPPEEYSKRATEQAEFIKMLSTKNKISFLEGIFDSDRFYSLTKGHESDIEGGDRCSICYKLRLEESAKIASENGFDFFTTTLSISPHKNSEKLNNIGNSIAEKYGVRYLESDFKKKNGYKRSTEISKEHGLYRQDYCGCVFSKKQALN